MHPTPPGRAWRAVGAALLLVLLGASCARSPAAIPAAPEVSATVRDAPPQTIAAARGESGAYVFTLGADTIGVERFVRTVNGLRVEQVLRMPRTTVRRYSMSFTPTGTLSSAEMTVFPPGDNTSATPTQTVRATLSGDSATIVTTRGDSVQTRSVATSSSALYVPFPSFAPYELMAQRARAAGRDTVVIPLVGFGQQQPAAARVIRLGADSLLFVQPGTMLRAHVAPNGQITSLHAPGMTFKVTARRVPTVDVVAVARAWAAQDAQGQAMGQASPRDTARATVAGARVLVDYGRPARRGRTVWGGELVPLDSVWRTGANAATRLVTDRDLVIGGATVPAGTYTLWTHLPRTGPWHLVINKLTTDSRGNPLWGTNYDASQDLARVDLQTRRLDQPVERFTITIEPAAQGGVLRMAWDTTEAFVPFTVR